MCGIKRPGFTLLELVVVVAIMAILATIIIPQLGRGNARKQREQFVMKFNTLLRHTAVDAIATNKVHKVIIDIVHHAITIQQQTTQKTTEGQWVYKTPRRAYAQVPLVIPPTYSVKNCVVEGFDEMSSFAGGTAKTVWFYIMPQGLAQAVTLNILDRTDKNPAQGQQFGLVLNPLTVQFRMYDAWQE